MTWLVCDVISVPKCYVFMSKLKSPPRIYPRAFTIHSIYKWSPIKYRILRNWYVCWWLTFHLSGKSVTDIQGKIQSNLLSKQMVFWKKMYINTEKTKCIAEGTRQKLSCQEDSLSLQINSEILQTSEFEKLLGVKVDPTLTWSAQIDQICSTISSWYMYYLLTKLKQYLIFDCRKLCNGYILH